MTPILNGQETAQNLLWLSQELLYKQLLGLHTTVLQTLPCDFSHARIHHTMTYIVQTDSRFTYTWTINRGTLSWQVAFRFDVDLDGRYRVCSLGTGRAAGSCMQSRGFS